MKLEAPAIFILLVGNAASLCFQTIPSVPMSPLIFRRMNFPTSRRAMVSVLPPTMSGVETVLKSAGGLKKAAIFVGGSMLGGISGTPVVVRALPAWYAGLQKPVWTPRNGAFAPVWTILYAMIGLSAAIVAEKTCGLTSPPMMLLAAHYIANLLWAPLFFGAKKILAAFVLNIALVVSLGVIINTLQPISKIATALLLPYAAWLTYATALNYRIWSLNFGRVSSPVFSESQIMTSNDEANCVATDECDVAALR